MQDTGGYAAAVAVDTKDYVGIVDLTDITALVMAKGLKRATPGTLVRVMPTVGPRGYSVAL